MKNRRKIRVMAWILTVVMLMTSLGLDALPVMAADAGSFTYEVSFDASFTTAEMTFTADNPGGGSHRKQQCGYFYQAIRSE